MGRVPGGGGPRARKWQPGAVNGQAHSDPSGVRAVVRRPVGRGADAARGRAAAVRTRADPLTRRRGRTGFPARDVRRGHGRQLRGRCLGPGNARNEQAVGRQPGHRVPVPVLRDAPDRIEPAADDPGRRGGRDHLTLHQWCGGTLLGMPFASRPTLQGVVPSDSYGTSRLINAGTNVWQVSPYYALTWRPLDKCKVNVRLIHGWSSCNTAPPPALGVGSVQPDGQFAANYAASYTAAPKLRLGLSGYVLRQVADTRQGVGRAAAAGVRPPQVSSHRSGSSVQLRDGETSMGGASTHGTCRGACPGTIELRDVRGRAQQLGGELAEAALDAVGVWLNSAEAAKSRLSRG